MSLKRKGANLPTNDAKKPKANASITSFFGPPKTASSTTKVTQATTAAVPASSSQVSTKTANGTADIDAATAEVSDAEFLALEAAAQGEESAPAPAPAPAPAARSWDKEAWVNKLTEEQKGLLRLEIETLHDSWLKELRNEITTDSFLELKRFLKKESEAGKQIFPPSGDVYSWFVALRSHFL
jgi:uracil-DNA glycosylase